MYNKKLNTVIHILFKDKNNQAYIILMNYIRRFSAIPVILLHLTKFRSLIRIKQILCNLKIYSKCTPTLLQKL